MVSRQPTQRSVAGLKQATEGGSEPLKNNIMFDQDDRAWRSFLRILANRCGHTQRLSGCPCANQSVQQKTQQIIHKNLQTKYLSGWCMYVRPDRVVVDGRLRDAEQTTNAHSTQHAKHTTNTPCETKHGVPVHPGVLKIHARRAVLEDDDLQLVVPPVSARANLTHHHKTDNKGAGKGRSAGNGSLSSMRKKRVHSLALVDGSF